MCDMGVRLFQNFRLSVSSPDPRAARPCCSAGSSACGSLEWRGLMSAPRTALLIDEYSEVLDLSSRGLIDTTSLLHCLRLTSLSLHENSHLSSIEGLQSCSRLWTVDLRGCALTSIQPILHLGALSELHLGGNRISLAAALKLRCMAIGRLGLQGNPLLSDDLRMALGVSPGLDDSRLLRSFLADEMPCVIALDDSFITSAPRHCTRRHCTRCHCTRCHCTRRHCTRCHCTRRSRPHRFYLSGACLCTQAGSAATAASTLTRLPPAELCGRCCCLATRRPGRARLRSSRATSCGREGEALSGQSLSSPCLRIGRCVRGSGPSLSDPSTSGCPWLPPFSLTRVWPHSSCAAPIRRRRRRSSPGGYTQAAMARCRSRPLTTRRVCRRLQGGRRHIRGSTTQERRRRGRRQQWRWRRRQ